MNCHKALTGLLTKWGDLRIVFGVVSCLFLIQSVSLAEPAYASYPKSDNKKEEEHADGVFAVPPPGADKSPTTGVVRRSGDAKGPEAKAFGCPVSPKKLSEFANGDNYDYENLVNFLSVPACTQASFAISKMAVDQGVSFHSVSPYRLDYYAAPLLNNNLEGVTKSAAALEQKAPTLLRQNPLSSRELLPLAGQFAILSPKAGRIALVNLIQQQLYTGNELLNQASGKEGYLAASAQIAQVLVRLGTNREIIASQFAESVEDMALMAQADSLTKIFRALGAAANADVSLVPAFNLSAGALNKGIQKSQGVYTQQDQTPMAKAVLAAIAAANDGSESFEIALAELNEAMNPLLKGVSLKTGDLKRLWNDVVKILAENPTQSTLADMLSFSITPDFIFLKPSQRDLLLRAAYNYPGVAHAIQRNFLVAWNRLNENHRKDVIPVERFENLKTEFLIPWVKELFELDPGVIDRAWLTAIVAGGFLKNKDIEKKFPVHVLTYIERSQRAAKLPVTDGSIEPTITSMAENLAVLWTLSNVHVPALMQWVENFERRQLAGKNP